MPWEGISPLQLEDFDWGFTPYRERQVSANETDIESITGQSLENVPQKNLPKPQTKGEPKVKAGRTILSSFSDPPLLRKTLLSPGTYNYFHKIIGPKQNLFRLKPHLPSASAGIMGYGLGSGDSGASEFALR